MRLKMLSALLVVCAVATIAVKAPTYQERRAQENLSARLITELRAKTQRNKLDPNFAKMRQQAEQPIVRTRPETTEESENKKPMSPSA